jgi:hypothetical protein
MKVTIALTVAWIMAVVAIILGPQTKQATPLTLPQIQTDNHKQWEFNEPTWCSVQGGPLWRQQRPPPVSASSLEVPEEKQALHLIAAQTLHGDLWDENKTKTVPVY